MVLEHDLRAFLSKRSRIRISAVSSPHIDLLRKVGRLCKYKPIYAPSTIDLSFWLRWFLNTHVACIWTTHLFWMPLESDSIFTKQRIEEWEFHSRWECVSSPTTFLVEDSRIPIHIYRNPRVCTHASHINTYIKTFPPDRHIWIGVSVTWFAELCTPNSKFLTHHLLA